MLAEKTLYRYGLLSTKHLSLPDFLGVGMVKAGTTWLHGNLRLHPELYLPIKKPIWYFDKYFHKTVHEYSRIFAQGKNKVKGEITADYSILPEKRIRFIKALIPDVKIIFLLRDPIERAWSEAKMECITLPKKNSSDVTDDTLCFYLQSALCKKRSAYAIILQEWLRVFPREQIYMGIMDDIVKDPKQLLSDIFSFLGVSVPETWEAFPYDKFFFEGTKRVMPERFAAEAQKLLSATDINYIEHLLKRDIKPLWNYA